MMEGIEDEVQEERVINEFKTSLELGLPEDGEMKTRTFLAGLYATRGMREVGRTHSDPVSNFEASEALRQIEKAVELDTHGSYSFFAKPANSRSQKKRYR